MFVVVCYILFVIVCYIVLYLILTACRADWDIRPQRRQGGAALCVWLPDKGVQGERGWGGASEVVGVSNVGVLGAS